jgi:hypothetical protein
MFEDLHSRGILSGRRTFGLLASVLPRSSLGSSLALLRRRGVAPAMLFSSMGLVSRYGAWGLLEAIDFAPETSAKYYGVQSFVGSLGGDAGGLRCSALPNAAVCLPPTKWARAAWP